MPSSGAASGPLPDTARTRRGCVAHRYSEHVGSREVPACRATSLGRSSGVNGSGVASRLSLRNVVAVVQAVLILLAVPAVPGLLFPTGPWYTRIGGYAGLSYFELITGSDRWTVQGQIFPGNPPKAIDETDPSSDPRSA